MAMWVSILVPLLLALASSQLMDQEVDDSVKNEIINLDEEDAFAMFLEIYDMSDPFMLMSTDPVTTKKVRAKKKKAFVKDLKKIKSHNKKYARGESSYSMNINSFSIMDAEERSQYLGLGNMSDFNPKYVSAPVLMASTELKALPATFDWRDTHMVTEVKNQGSCGSCWAFAAVGVLEYAYTAATGKLWQFSEQELLDCTYETSAGKDGCRGGWYTRAWDFVIEQKHLTTLENYPYQNRDGQCSHSSHVNVYKNKLQITGYTRVDKDVTAAMRAVQIMPLAVAFTVEDDFYTVGSGVYDGCRVAYSPNHAVIMTGYGSNYWEIKNSWGKDWATEGFGKLKRENMCGILNSLYYLEYKDLDKNDFDDSNKGEDNDGDDKIDRSSCMDRDSQCTAYKGRGFCDTKKYTDYADWMGINCKSSCNNCECVDKDAKCTRWTSEGYCKNDEYVTWMQLNCGVSCGMCDQCKAGYYTSWQGCVQCKEGTYSGYGASKCESCSLGTSSPAGATSASQCVKQCNAGYYSQYGSCKICPKDTYSSKGASECTKCSSGYTSNSGSIAKAACKKQKRASCTNVETEKKCLEWAEWCSSGSYVEYMKVNCAKQCGYCESNCKDTNSDCSYWAKLGYCTSDSYKIYMTASCGKSCGTCSDEEEEEDQCAGGLTWCDGKCKHVHMCGRG